MTAAIQPGAWILQAACSQIGDDYWHPDRGQAHSAATSAARRVCAGCPVRVECLTHALEFDERHGMWGGLTVGERRKLRAEAGLPKMCTRCRTQPTASQGKSAHLCNACQIRERDYGALAS